MKKLVASILVGALAVALTLSAVSVLVAATIRISEMSDFVWRALTTAAVFLAGFVWLLATVYLATRMAVLIFREDEPPKI